MLVDQILVAAQLGGAVAADGFQVVGGAGVVERIRSQVHHPEVRIRVLQELLFIRLHGVGGLGVLGRLEIAVVEIALVDGPQVGQDEDAERGDHPGGLEFLGHEEPEDRERGRDEEEAAPGVAREEGGAVGHDGAVERFGNLRFKGGVVGAGEREDRTAQQGEEQAQAGRHAAGNIEFLPGLFLGYVTVHQGLDSQEAQQGHGDFRHDQDRGDGPELVVERKVVEEELGEAHEVVPPGQGYREQGGGQQRPFVGPFDQQAAEQEQEADDGAGVNVACRERLFAPVERDVGAEAPR